MKGGSTEPDLAAASGVLDLICAGAVGGATANSGRLAGRARRQRLQTGPRQGQTMHMGRESWKCGAGNGACDAPDEGDAAKHDGLSANCEPAIAAGRSDAARVKKGLICDSVRCCGDERDAFQSAERGGVGSSGTSWVVRGCQSRGRLCGRPRWRPARTRPRSARGRDGPGIMMVLG
jgi:hypothetical protein